MVAMENVSKKSNAREANQRLNQILPPYVPDTPLVARVKNTCRTVFQTVFIVTALCVVVFAVFVVYRVFRERETFWHYLKNNQTIAVTLSPNKKMQTIALDDVLARLTTPGQTLQQKLLELTIAGYAEHSWSRQGIVVYDEKRRADYRMTFEEHVQTAIAQAYRIYNNFDPDVEREVYGVTTDALIYEMGLAVEGYAPMTLRKSLYEGRRYFPFALIAGQIADIDPLRLLKIFEIETGFSETAVGRNTERVINDDIGIAQNNLLVLPRLIRDILNPETPVYCPFFEFLPPGKDLETGETLTWANYLVRLEEELNGTYNRQKDPTGKYYINLLKAPHIGAFLAAYHIKRDQTYSLYGDCMKFYHDNADALRRELSLAQALNPYHWTDYSFYNGGPKRWYVVKKFLTMRQNGESIPPELKEAVMITRRRNIVAQKIGEKNAYLKSLAFDETENALIANDGLFRYGLFDFSPSFTPREFMYHLNRELAALPDQ